MGHGPTGPVDAASTASTACSTAATTAGLAAVSTRVLSGSVALGVGTPLGASGSAPALPVVPAVAGVAAVLGARVGGGEPGGRGDGVLHLVAVGGERRRLVERVLQPAVGPGERAVDQVADPVLDLVGALDDLAAQPGDQQLPALGQVVVLAPQQRPSS